MEKEATKIFEIVLNNSNNLTKEISMQVYKLLDLEGKVILPNVNENARLLEQIQTSIETFAFNLKETEFLGQVQEIIKEEMQKLQTSSNYDLTENSLIERLKGLKNIDISLESDFKDLSSKIASSFHSQDEYYNYFVARQEKISNMIKSYNQNIINSLINLTPKLIEELKSENEKKPVSQEVRKEEPSVDLGNLMRDIDSKIDGMNRIDGLITACKNKYNKLQRRFSYLTSGAISNVNSSKIMLEKEEIRKALKQLTELIQKLSASKYAKDLISKYSDITDMNLFCEKVISEIAPSSVSVVNMTNVVDNMYSNQFTTSFKQFSMPEINIDELHQQIVNTNDLAELLSIKEQIENAMGNQYYDTNIRLEVELSMLVDKIVALTMENSKNKSQDPNTPTPSINAEIGESKDDIMALINSNNYFSILQGIQSSKIEKYREFIMLGFNTIMNRWQQQAALSNTFEERQKSYFEFVELYENFKDYLPMDVVDMLTTNLNAMKKFIEQSKTKITDIDGIRYNGTQEQTQSSMKI